MNDTNIPGIFQSRNRSITLNLDDDLIDSLETIAVMDGISRSEAARWLLRFGVSVVTSEDPAVGAFIDRMAEAQN